VVEEGPVLDEGVVLRDGGVILRLGGEGAAERYFR
jgi:hypothetical protein